MTAPTPTRRFFRALRHPCAGALALAFISISAAMLPRYPGSPSVAGRCLPSWQARPTGSRVVFVDRTLVHERDSVGAVPWSVVEPLEGSWDAMQRIIDGPSQPAFSASFADAAHVAGFWNPWIRTRAQRISISTLSGNPTPEQVAQARAAFADWLARAEGFHLLPGLDRGDELERSVVWSGAAWNAATLIAGAVLAWSLTGVPGFIRARRVNDRLAHGLCPACRYNLSNTPPVEGVTTCPECGRAWTLPERP